MSVVFLAAPRRSAQGVVVFLASRLHGGFNVGYHAVPL